MSSMDMTYEQLAAFYRDQLVNDVVPFWEKHSLDRECGGYLTCLDRKGQVYDTDKFVWLQARQAWMFSFLYDRLERREEWLEVARHGAEFLRRHGRDKEGNWYFSLDRAGRPLIQPYNIFSDCFAAMAFSQFARITNDEESRQIALRTYHNILARKDQPKGLYTKAYPGTRPLKALAIPMILANLSMEMAWLLPADELEQATQMCLHEVMEVFLDHKRMLMFEHMATDGSHVNCFEGRLINPGHGLEAMWFIMDIANQRGLRDVVEQTIKVILSILDFGWDEQNGGIFYFLDAQGHPPQQLEWDQKLWWVHQETLVALAMGHRLTGCQACWEWFGRVHEWSWNHFADPKYGEWFGYLNRRGEVLLPLKGGKWKGCFHLPRALYRCSREFELLAQEKGCRPGMHERQP